MNGSDIKFPAFVCKYPKTNFTKIRINKKKICIKGAGGTQWAFVLLGHTKYLSGWHDRHDTCYYIVPYGYRIDPDNGIPPEKICIMQK